MRKLSVAGLFIVLVVGFASCTIEKRLYRDGFYIDRHDSKRVDGDVKHDRANIAKVFPAEPIAPVAEPIVAGTQTISQETKSEEARESKIAIPPPVADRVYEKLPEKIQQAAPPIEKDKKQAMGAGVAAAIFFLIAMGLLFFSGAGMQVGIFVGAAFVCCLLCIILASFLYPKEPVVKQPKEAGAPLDTATKIGIGFALAIFALLVLIVVGFLSLIGIF